MGLEELKAQVDESAAALAAEERTARHAASDVQAAADDHAALAQAYEREVWVQAQRDLGVPEEHIDADRRVVTNLPLGPVHVAGDTNAAGGGGAVTFHPESDEAEAIRRDPSAGAALAADQPVNPAAHLPYEEPAA